MEQAGLGKGYGEQSLSANVDSWPRVCSKYYTEGGGGGRRGEGTTAKGRSTTYPSSSVIPTRGIS